MNGLPVKKYFNPQELASTMINVLHDVYSLPIEELKVKKVDDLYKMCINIIQLNLSNLMSEGKVTEAVNYLKGLYPGLIPEKLIVNRLNSGDISGAKGLLKFVYNLYTYESLLDFEVDRSCLVWFIRCRLAFNGEPFRVFIKKVVEGNEVPKGLVDRMTLV